VLRRLGCGKDAAAGCCQARPTDFPEPQSIPHSLAEHAEPATDAIQSSLRTSHEPVTPTSGRVTCCYCVRGERKIFAIAGRRLA